MHELPRVGHPEVSNGPQIDAWVLSLTVATSKLETTDPHLDTWNQAVIQDLLRKQLETNEGCFFVGLCVLSRAFYPNRPLPSAQSVWEEARKNYSHLLQPNKLLVAHDKLAIAFEEVYRTWGISLEAYSLNANGHRMIGHHMARISGPPKELLPSYNSLPTENLAFPYAMLLHQAGGNDTHFLADDGSIEAAQARAKYQTAKLPYRTIATFELQRLLPEKAFVH